MSLDHQEVYLTLESPDIRETNDLGHWCQIRDVQNLLKSFQILGCFEWESNKDLISILLCFDQLILEIMSFEDNVILLP